MTTNVGTKTDCAKSAHASQQTARPPWRRPRQPHPGTRIIRYRCFLPDLAEFANYRRGGTDGATMNVKRRRLVVLLLNQLQAVASTAKLAERAGFEPAIRVYAVYTLSRRAPSTTRTPLRLGALSRGRSSPTKKRNHKGRLLDQASGVAPFQPAPDRGGAGCGTAIRSPGAATR